MTPKERLRQIEARAERLCDIVRGLGERRRDARETAQRAAATVREYEAWRGPEPPTSEVLSQAKRDAAEAEETFKRLDANWSAESARLAAAQQLAEACRSYAEQAGLVAPARGARLSQGGEVA